MTASQALEHSFIEFSNHRGLGDRISLDRHRGYIFRRKAEVSYAILVLISVINLCMLAPYTSNSCMYVTKTCVCFVYSVV